LKSESATGATSWQKRVEEVAQRLARQEDDFRVQAERIAELEEIAKNPPVVAIDPAGAPGGPAAPAVAAWKAAIPDLTSTNQNQRWMAVDAIGHSGDPEAVPYLVPMLKDADVFVRMAAARVLGDMKATAAVPALIDALEDADTPVRDAAWTAFSSIAGTHLQFDAGANEAERARRIKAIREWWKKTEEEASKK
jgi:HEAT repeat protein